MLGISFVQQWCGLLDPAMVRASFEPPMYRKVMRYVQSPEGLAHKRTIR
jgi:hypothetical protein